MSLPQYINSDVISSVLFHCLGDPTPALAMLITRFHIGDRIWVTKNEQGYKQLQEGHGGWNTEMQAVSSYPELNM